MKIEIPTNLSESAAAEIQAIIDREKAKGGAFVPKEGDQYWLKSEYGTPQGVGWADDAYDKGQFILGNCHPTREAAEAAAPAYFAKIDAQYAIALWLAEHQNWLATDEEKADSLVNKYYVRYKRAVKLLDTYNWCHLEPIGAVSFRSPEYAEQFIAECGEHLRVVHGLPKEEGK